MQEINIELYKNPNIFVTDAYERFVSKIPVMKDVKGYALFTVSGCEPSVGTTTIAINTAVSLAESRRRTLLVDADMRKRREKRLNHGLEFGLSDFLIDEFDFYDVACHTNIDHLNYISSGRAVDNPTTLLNSNNFDLFLRLVTNEYDYVIFDSPTLNATVDAGIIGSKTSGVVLVAAYMQTRMAQIKAAKKELEQLNANVMGILLNNVPKNRYKRYVEHYNYFYKK